MVHDLSPSTEGQARPGALQMCHVMGKRGHVCRLECRGREVTENWGGQGRLDRGDSLKCPLEGLMSRGHRGDLRA